jgi:integrase
MAKLKLTKTAVAALPIPADKPAVYWDTDTSGLGVRVSPGRGRKTYFLQSRARTGRGVKLTLGCSDRLTPDQAREAAKKHLAAIALDRDPAAERREKREAERERRRQAKLEEEAATLADLWRAFEREHVAKLRPASQDAYGLWYARHIAPRLGSTRLRDLTRGKIQGMVREIAEASGQSTANRSLAVVSGMLSFGEAALDKNDERRFPDATNCCRGIRNYPEPGREREMTDEELARLIHFLAASPALEARLLELALATGARRNELLHMSWSEITGSWWIIPGERSKSRKRQRKPLSAAALGVLAKLDRRADPFAGLTESRLSHWWLRTRSPLGLNDLRVHDLRHAAASLAISAGVPLAAIGAMLGHGVNSAAMTARYSHLADASLVLAGDAVAKRLDTLLREAEPVGRA